MSGKSLRIENIVEKFYYLVRRFIKRLACAILRLDESNKMKLGVGYIRCI